MKSFKLIILLSFLMISLAFCKNPDKPVEEIVSDLTSIILPAADQPETYLPLLEGKRVGLVVNQTSILTQSNNMHLVDFLMMEGIDVKKVFVPEHGFRGDADAGEAIKSEVDKATGLPIVSLYGDNKKPSKASLNDIDI